MGNLFFPYFFHDFLFLFFFNGLERSWAATILDGIGAVGLVFYFFSLKKLLSHNDMDKVFL